MKYFFECTLIILSLLSFSSCNNDNIVTEPGKTFQKEPGKTFQSDGNNWLPTTMWPDTGNSVYYVSLQDIVVNKNDEIFVATDFAGVFKTSDLGMNWETVNEGLIKTMSNSDTNYFVSSLISLNNDIFCGNSNLSTKGGIYYLRNSDEMWMPKIVWNEYSVITTLEKNNNGEIFAGCYYGLYLSNDGGNNWIDISNGLAWDKLAYAYTIAFDSSDRIYIGTRDGIYLSDNNGSSWSQIGLNSEAVLSIAINSKDEIFALLENSHILTSTDKGLHWKEILNPETFYIRHIFINLDDIIFLSTSDGIYRSNNDGEVFKHIGLQNIAIEKIVITSKGYMIAASFRDGIFISKE